MPVKEKWGNLYYKKGSAIQKPAGSQGKINEKNSRNSVKISKKSSFILMFFIYIRNCLKIIKKVDKITKKIITVSCFLFPGIVDITGFCFSLLFYYWLSLLLAWISFSMSSLFIKFSNFCLL